MAQSWVGAVAARKGSDLAASGAGNGLVRLWAIEPDSKGIRPLFKFKLVWYSCYSLNTTVLKIISYLLQTSDQSA